MKRRDFNYPLVILNVLMTYDGGGKALTTNKICELTGCERKTVYKCMDVLECNGFGIEIVAGKYNANTYRLVKTYGF